MKESPRTFAILVGTSEFPEDDTLTPIPNVAVNLREWENVLRDEGFIGLPKERIFKIYNQSRRKTLKELRRAAEKANRPTDRLIIYFAGHGVYSSDYEFCLAVHDTEVDDVDITGIPGRIFRDTVQKNAHAQSIVFVMDCCYSGNFSENMGDASTAIQQELKKSGNYILTATDKDSPAKFDPDCPDTPTAFTGFLLEGIRQGIAGKGDLLSFEDLKDYTVARARETSNPSPEATAHKDGNTLKFFKNKAAKTQAQKEAEAWEAAKAQDSIEAYTQFEDAYPQSKHCEEAEHRAYELELAKAWERAEKAGTSAAFRAFLNRYPHSKYEEEAQKQYRQLREKERKARQQRTNPPPPPEPKQETPPKLEVEKVSPVVDKKVEVKSQTQKPEAPKKQKREKSPLPWWPFAAVGGLLLVFVAYSYWPNINEETSTETKLHPELQKLIDDLVLVKGGTFKMGCTSEQSDCGEDEKPVHSVTLSDFHIGKFEVTQAQWRAVMGSDPPELEFKGCDKCPVEMVSWNDVQKFLKKLRQLTGRNFTLPTEAQWEYAARGGKKSKGYKYAGSDSIGNVAWYWDNSSNKTHPVGRKSPNELGLYDMSGNVWEWCSDWYGSAYYANSPSKAPTGPSNGSYRVYRGGGWGMYAESCRVAPRAYYPPAALGKILGFRCAVSP